jgi:hypothetical protein
MKLWMAWLLLPALALAESHILLVDCSGSMKGFFESGAVRVIVSVLDEVLPLGSVRKLGFIDHRDLELPASLRLPGYGRETFISEAYDRELDRSRSPRILWLLTDNIQSNETATGDMQAFFDALHQGDRVASVCIYPMRTHFTGPKYDANDRLVGQHVGPNGMLLYQIELDRGAQGQSFADQLKNVTSALKQSFSVQSQAESWVVDGARIRPFDPGSIDLKAERNTKECEVISGVRDTLRFSGVKPLEVNRRIQINFPFRPYSRLDDIVIREVRLVPRAGEPVHSDFLLGRDDIKLACTPDVIRDVRRGPHVVGVNAHLEIQNLRIRNSLSSWLRCFWASSGWLRIPMDIRYEFPGSQIQLDISFITPFVEEIPGLDGLARELYHKNNMVESMLFYVEVPVKYPLYPAFIILSFLLLGLAALVGIVLAYVRRGTWLLTRGEDYQRTIRPFLVGHYPMAEVSITHLLGKWGLKPRRGWELAADTPSSFAARETAAFQLVSVQDELDDPFESGSGGDEDEVRYRIEPKGRMAGGTTDVDAGFDDLPPLDDEFDDRL